MWAAALCWIGLVEDPSLVFGEGRIYGRYWRWPRSVPLRREWLKERLVER